MIQRNAIQLRCFSTFSTLNHFLLTSIHQSSRGLTTTHRPTPQPSISNRTKPLMQTFHSSASASSPAPTSTNLDATVLPSLDFESTVVSSGFRMPLLPDNYNTAHGPTTADGPVTKASIVAADPEVVAPGTPLSAVEGINLDGIELKFVHEQEAQPEEHSSMLKDLWKGMVDDVLGPAKKTA